MPQSSVMLRPETHTLMTKNYYPETNDERADWWQNIITNGAGVFTQVGLTPAQQMPVILDAEWAVYLYRTLRLAYEEATKRVTGYADSITDGSNGTPAPAEPAMPV